MLYLFTNEDELSALPAIPGLKIKETYDPVLLSAIGEMPEEEVLSRLTNDHSAYVAYLNGIPAAFGWLAAGKARIGELNHEFVLPIGHRYFWNFRTLHSFRGLGIYPHLLQQIIVSEKRTADHFWIMHAPENKASERGIIKAGFRFIGHVSVVNHHEVIFDDNGYSQKLADVLTTFNFAKSEEEQASCWNCSSPYLKKRKGECCCATNNVQCTKNLFQPLTVTKEYHEDGNIARQSIPELKLTTRSMT